jgi:hypothetical protein
MNRRRRATSAAVRRLRDLAVSVSSTPDADIAAVVTGICISGVAGGRSVDR